MPPSAQREHDFGYDEVLIVAHSLGAVIARRALLDATRNRWEWIARTKLFFYAPAHKGATVADLVLEAASSFKFLKLFGIGARFESPLVDELKSDSRPLKTLLEETEIATKDGANKHLIAIKVVIAEFEKVVNNQIFANDPPPVAIPNSTHTSVCKPTKEFRLPLAILEECL